MGSWLVGRQSDWNVQVIPTFSRDGQIMNFFDDR